MKNERGMVSTSEILKLLETTEEETRNPIAVNPEDCCSYTLHLIRVSRVLERQVKGKSLSQFSTKQMYSRHKNCTKNPVHQSAMLKELDKLVRGQKLGSRAIRLSHLLANTRPK